MMFIFLFLCFSARRSPDPDPENPRASMGGWGLGDGVGGEETQKTDLDELYADAEGLDWDKTQVRLSLLRCVLD